MREPSPEQIRQAVREAGIVGAGGGGFPAHVKLDAQVDVVLANGAECEPLARVDQQLMAREPERVLRGLFLVMRATGAREGIVGIKAKHGDAIATLRQTIKDRHLEGQLRVHELRDFYPAGDEFVLVREILGRIIPEFGLPLSVGAVVSNVATLADVTAAVDEGTPVTHREVTVAGEVARPSTFRVPVGTPLQDLVDAAGGTSIPDAKILVGGPMMGVLAQDPAQPVTKTTSVLVVLPPKHPVVQRRVLTTKRAVHLTRSACLKCVMCTEVCPRNALGHRLYPDRLMRNVAVGVCEDLEAYQGAYLCSECGLCAVYGCVQNLDPCTMNREFKRQLGQAGAPRPTPQEDAVERLDGPVRRVPSRRLIARLGVSVYDGPAPLAPFESTTGALTILLHQHAGAPAAPVVEAGRRVMAGDLIGEIPPGKLGARVHASVDGTIAAVTDSAIVIERSR